MLSGADLDLTFPGAPRPVIAGADLHVAAQETVALIGASGSGKSTLLRVLSGLRLADRGEVRLDGQPMPPPGDATRRLAWHRQVLLLPQDTARAFNPALRLRTQFRAALALHGQCRDGAARDALAADALAQCGVPRDALDRHADELSGGQRQRAALARLLCLRPRMLLLDEPTAALDPATALDLLDLMTTLRDRHRFGLLIATHDERVMSRADRVLRMRDGCLSAA
ncbi:MAG TPA: ATP-binding cassette domain-containing protein [Roseomonas sp.]|nr:ATP-binding cassette domain-containing protein [Roseomonas sp.]